MFPGVGEYYSICENSCIKTFVYQKWATRRLQVGKLNIIWSLERSLPDFCSHLISSSCLYRKRKLKSAWMHTHFLKHVHPGLNSCFVCCIVCFGNGLKKDCFLFFFYDSFCFFLCAYLCVWLNCNVFACFVLSFSHDPPSDHNSSPCCLQQQH